ncbi:MAG: F0F1 ATP synthase subunit A, partial [Clostridia bacterium]|nr:F0F1 ATP synthase subunit A [Clostridia bacterium]
MDNINITGAKIYFTIPVGDGIPVTETQVNSWIVILAIFILCLVLTRGIAVRPASKRQLVAEWIVEQVENLVRQNMGEEFLPWSPFICAILGLSAFSSLTALLGMYPPT